jgi:AraC family transcriptional regulator
MGQQLTGRDRLRELLDAVLEAGNSSLEAMARGAHASPSHFHRQLSRAVSEPPVAMRRRVMLERAAYLLRRGVSVTEVALASGYESVEGFSRAFQRAYGHPPSRLPDGVGPWLPAPNGIHFHPPASLWVSNQEQTMSTLTEQQVHHDLDDIAALLDLAVGLPEAELRRVQLPGHTTLPWDGAEESLAHVLARLVSAKEVWLAAIEGTDLPPERGDDAATLVRRHAEVAPRWLDAVRDIDRRGAWDDLLIDALCDPPESFVISSVVAHVLTFSAYRRLLARQLLRGLGREVDTGDPIEWLRARIEEGSA